MDSSLHGITPLRQRMIDDMRMRKFADKTQSHYIRAVRQLAAFLGRSPDTATVEDLRHHWNGFQSDRTFFVRFNSGHLVVIISSAHA